MTAVEHKARLGPNIAGPAARGQPGFRYGAVLGVILVLLIVEVLSPDTDLAHALSVALAAGALTVAVATSRERAAVRRRRARVVGIAAVVTVIGIATGAISVGVTWLIATVVVALIPLALGGGLLRLIRDEGVTLQAVAGALAVYLIVGLLFASLISFISYAQSGSYFSQHGPVTNGDRVYYSFTVLTTTGFGDYTAATALGHTVAVLEMLTGQLYLVTVIGVLVGNYSGRAAASRASARSVSASGSSGASSPSEGGGSPGGALG